LEFLRVEYPIVQLGKSPAILAAGQFESDLVGCLQFKSSVGLTRGYVE
jgi:hypothetical protein